MDECYTIESNWLLVCARWRFDLKYLHRVFLVVCSRSQVRGAPAQLPIRDDRRFTRKHSTFFWGLQFGATSFRFSFPSENNAKGNDVISLLNHTNSQRTHTFLCSLGKQHRTRKTKRSLLLLEAPRTQLNTYTNARKVVTQNTRTRLDDFRLSTNTAQDRLNEATKQAESDGGGVGKNVLGWLVASRRSPNANARTHARAFLLLFERSCVGGLGWFEWVVGLESDQALS